MAGFFIFITIGILILEVILAVKLHPDNYGIYENTIYGLIWFGIAAISTIPLISFILASI